MKTVVIAMSGGVDSSVAAALLLKDGYRVIGLTMKLWQDLDALKKEDPAIDAKKVADILGIEHHIVDLKKTFKDTVVEYFIDEYAQGRTPNPCVYCNKKIKFGALYSAAMELGADYLATGHYVRLAVDEKGVRHIEKAKHIAKDQSYVLYHLNQEILSHVIFPLGEYDKPQIRDIAKELNLPVFAKKDSQEICFIPDNDYHGFLKKYGKGLDHPGKFVTKNGKVLGEHKGLSHYTVGQRKGLGLVAERPLFVMGLNAKDNTVIVGFAEESLCKGLVAENVVFADGKVLEAPQKVEVKIRYNAKPVLATVFPKDNNDAEVIFLDSQRAPAPGQAVVFYEGDICLGGGIIKSGLKS